MSNCACAEGPYAAARSVQSREMMAENDKPPAAFWQWKYRHYFDYVGEKDEKNITLRCRLCPGNKNLSCGKISTANLKKHIEAKHKNTTLVARGEEDHRDTNNNDAAGPSAPKQQKIDFSQTVTKKEINKLVAGYVVEDMRPLSTVESKSFRKIISKIPMPGNKPGEVSDRKTFSRYLDKAYCDMEKELKSTFDGLEYVSTTADLWTANNKSFMGMTVHWIEPSTLTRKKAGIACRRVRGRHTYNVCASEIEQIHTSYGLSGKVTATVTDNGSNFVKAFKVYQEEGDTVSDPGSEAEEEEEETSVTFEDLHAILSTPDEEDSGDNFVLPPHHRCASHTLNLIATNDIEKWLLSNSEWKAVYRSSTAKCCGLWNKASRYCIVYAPCECL